MRITEIRIKLMDDPSDRLRAFCSITLDDSFVVRDLKIIEGSNGPFVAMPSRKLTSHCPQCGCKNHLRASYCNQCGQRMKEELTIKDKDGRAKLYADIAHPINTDCRELIQEHVIEEFDAELERATQPGYKSLYDEYYDESEEVVDAADKVVTGQPASRKEPRPPQADGSHRTGRSSRTYLVLQDASEPDGESVGPYAA